METLINELLAEIAKHGCKFSQTASKLTPVVHFWYGQDGSRIFVTLQFVGRLSSSRPHEWNKINIWTTYTKAGQEVSMFDVMETFSLEDVATASAIVGYAFKHHRLAYHVDL